MGRLPINFVLNFLKKASPTPPQKLSNGLRVLCLLSCCGMLIKRHCGDGTKTVHLRLDLTLCDLLFFSLYFNKETNQRKQVRAVTRSRRVLIDERNRQLKHLKPREIPWIPVCAAFFTETPRINVHPSGTPFGQIRRPKGCLHCLRSDVPSTNQPSSLSLKIHLIKFWSSFLGSSRGAKIRAVTRTVRSTPLSQLTLTALPGESL